MLGCQRSMPAVEVLLSKGILFFQKCKLGRGWYMPHVRGLCGMLPMQSKWACQYEVFVNTVDGRQPYALHEQISIV